MFSSRATSSQLPLVESEDQIDREKRICSSLQEPNLLSQISGAMSAAPSVPSPPAVETANANLASPTRPIDACITGNRHRSGTHATIT